MLDRLFTYLVTIIGLWILSGVQCDQNLRASKRINENATSIRTDGDCKLYTSGIIFTKRVKDPNKVDTYKTHTAFMSNHALSLSQSGGDCVNRSGSIELVYENIVGSDDKALTKFTLWMNITYLKSMQWWQVDMMEITANGPFVEDPTNEVHLNWSGAVMKSVNIGADKHFNYACSRTNELRYGIGKSSKVIYGLQFHQLHLQPFRWNSKKNVNGTLFTDNVDDCVEFFSSGIWMFLVSAFIFLLITISGLVMLANMTTVNRFDDPKSKPMVVNAKE